MNIAAQARQLASIRVSALFLGRVVTGLGLALLFVTVQYAFARDIPMPFAPVLALVIGAAWYSGLVVGGTMAITATCAVNFLLLQPKRGWSTGNHELLATVTFGFIAILIATMISKVRASFSQLKLKLDGSCVTG
jgi:K+-sensing histidine kinase KdpD